VRGPDSAACALAPKPANPCVRRRVLARASRGPLASSMLRRGDRVGDGEQFGIVAQQLEHLAIEPQLWHV
jgi:hypothetical protein